LNGSKFLGDPEEFWPFKASGRGARARPLLARRDVQGIAALAAYVVLTVVMTWPIARGLAHDVPADLGDALLVMGVMAWVSEGLVAIARGAATFADLWNVNFFHPTPLGLTFSEHFVPQAVQGLPAYLATGNIVLAYNLTFLATFVLSGLGMFLFIRELTGSARAGFVAGLFYAFFPYRVGNFPHLHTLSSQWMPFVLYGFRRYFDTGRRVPLAGAAAAFVVQALSTGYYLFFFAPILVAYVVWEIVTRGRLREWRTWVEMAAAGVASAACTLPFLLPYAEAQARFGNTRQPEELLGFSADLFTYAHAPPQLHLWGPILSRFPQPEGGIFPGVTPVVFGLVAVALWVRRLWAARVALGPDTRRERVAGWCLVLAGAFLAAAAVVVVAGGATASIGGLVLRVTSVTRPIALAAICGALALWGSAHLRTALRTHAADLTPWLFLALTFAVVMSLGPRPRAGGRPIGGGDLYEFFFAYVPGYAGLRVPARFGMVAGCLLAALGGYALARLAAWRHGAIALTLVAVLFLAEAFAVPHAVNLSWQSSTRYAAPWPSVHRVNDGPLAYRHLLLMPSQTVVLELPFGDQGWDLRYVYYAGLHGKRIVNGYSGYFPDGYAARAARLAAIWTEPDAAWQAVTSAAATHVLVHEGAYLVPEGTAVSGWLEGHGATRVATFADGDVLLALPAR
jgi:hypothetical protein